ncbi:MULTISPECIES: hypothetical protein [Roseivirga]|uniref:Uncharacterized protein n=1 Tax=Roseivirga thermotolerans TaxID=1758176 RepID=A0ABQ3I8X5_9BACT|nr:MULTISPECIES: hypothetical protein [Roseivirga]MEC7752394.1 hypothetical protein [Bacteroidota bacterium]GHE67898.1 hypothetical protein GCM10011340_24380 [Roseivirga thermotolerans]|tara:strand:- start:1489 stop:2070 length:582 start_codon:yes stop_codon:yes gene_type:complete
MGKKAVFLFLLIALPVMIFLFLKFFGRNEFTIPVYYEQGLGDSLSTPCLDKANKQYLVNSDLLPKGGINIVHFEQADGPVLKSRLEELERVQDVFYEDDHIRLNTFLNSQTIALDDITDYNRRIQFLDQFWNMEALDSASWAELKYCSMAMTPLDNRVVLVDAAGRIRGYYNILERKETDRLILELRILKTEE